QHQAVLHLVDQPCRRLQTGRQLVDNVVQKRKGGRCGHSPRLFPESYCAPAALTRASKPVRYWSACTPATSQPLEPLLGLDMFQTSRNGLGPADGSSRIMPENSTLAR